EGGAQGQVLYHTGHATAQGLTAQPLLIACRGSTHIYTHTCMHTHTHTHTHRETHIHTGGSVSYLLLRANILPQTYITRTSRADLSNLFMAIYADERLHNHLTSEHMNDR